MDEVSINADDVKKTGGQDYERESISTHTGRTR
jgi:hypothetical protein